MLIKYHTGLVLYKAEPWLDTPPPPWVRHKSTACALLGQAKSSEHQELFKHNRQWIVLGMCSRSHSLAFLLKQKAFGHLLNATEHLTLGRVAGASGCMWCRYIHVLVSGVPFCGLLSTGNVSSNLLSEVNLFSSFLMEKHDNLWIQNVLCSILC